MRHWVFWAVIVLSMFHFLVTFALIYMKCQYSTDVENRFLARIMDQIQVFGTGASYERFLHRQAANVTILLAYAAVSLVATDFHSGGMNFYLSKPIGKIHYLLGKGAALAGMTALLTWVPAMGLFVEVAVYSSDFRYAAEHTHILLAITGYSLLLMTAPSLLAMATAATLRKTGAILVAWIGLLIVLPAFGGLLWRITHARVWLFLSFPRNMEIVADGLFGTTRPQDEGNAAIALAIVVGVGAASIALVLNRLRAVEAAT